MAILCEPLLKQLQISQYNATSFNVFDFEFFLCIADHRKLNVQIATLLLESLTKIALSSVFYAEVSVIVLRAVIMRFQENQEILQHWKDSFMSLIGQITFIETAITQHNKAQKEPKADMFNRLYQ